MNKPTVSLSALILTALLLWSVPAAGEVYRCRTVDGSLVFTDDPSRFPAGCRPLEGRGPGGLSVVPTTVPAPTQPSAADQGREAPSEAGPSLLDEARSLVQAYEQAQTERIGSLPPVQVQQALDRMQELEAQKAELLERLQAAPLTPAEKRQVRGVLAPIPEP